MNGFELRLMMNPTLDAASWRCCKANSSIVSDVACSLGKYLMNVGFPEAKTNNWCEKGLWEVFHQFRLMPVSRGSSIQCVSTWLHRKMGEQSQWVYSQSFRSFFSSLTCYTLAIVFVADVYAEHHQLILFNVRWPCSPPDSEFYLSIEMYTT